jgi:hypothetical protein
MVDECSMEATAGSKIKEKILIVITLSALTAYLPTAIHNQFITGPLVNMSLILAVFLIGPYEAVFLGLIPSVLALVSGLLPAALAPAVPFIMISNAILIGVYHYLGKKNFGISIFTAAFLKFLFLYLVTGLLVSYFVAGTASVSLAAMFGWVQLATAIVGGLLAFVILVFMRRLNQKTA